MSIKQETKESGEGEMTLFRIVVKD